MNDFDIFGTAGKQRSVVKRDLLDLLGSVSPDQARFARRSSRTPDWRDICCSQVQHRRQHNQRVFDYRKGFKMPNTMIINGFPDFENNRKMQSRRTALRAALAADSLALGVHWNYSVSSSIYSCFRRFAHARPLADVALRF